MKKIEKINEKISLTKINNYNGCITAYALLDGNTDIRKAFWFAYDTTKKSIVALDRWWRLSKKECTNLINSLAAYLSSKPA